VGYYGYFSWKILFPPKKIIPNSEKIPLDSLWQLLPTFRRSKKDKSLFDPQLMGLYVVCVWQSMEKTGFDGRGEVCVDVVCKLG